MPHVDVILDGKRQPSVTEITGVLSKGKWLLLYYAKHGTLKLNALREAMGVSEEEALGKLPDAFFEKSGIDREDFWKDAEALKTKAQERGVGLHGKFEEVAKILMAGTALPDDPFVAALLAWLNHRKLSFKAFEKFVVSQEHKFGGTFDALMTDPSGQEIVVDWKFTNRLKQENVLQLAGYDIALGGNPRPGCLVRISEGSRIASCDKQTSTKAGASFQLKGSKVKFEEHFIPNLGVYHEHFLMCRKLVDFMSTYPL